jgi:hypothetical protein
VAKLTSRGEDAMNNDYTTIREIGRAAEARAQMVWHIARELTDAGKAIPPPQDQDHKLIAEVRSEVDLIALRRLRDFLGRLIDPVVVPLKRPTNGDAA